MNHALTNSTACNTANAMALATANMGAGSEIVEMRRKARDSYDLTYVVQGPTGARNEVVVRNRDLQRRLARSKKEFHGH